MKPARSSKVVDEELAEVLAAQHALREEARKALGVLDAYSHAVMQTGVRLVDYLGDELRRAMERRAGAVLFGWNDQLWQTFAGPPPDAVLTEIRIGRYREVKHLSGEGGPPDIPFLIPLLEAAGPLVLQCDEKSKPIARTILQGLLLRTAIAMPSQARFTLLDPAGLGAAYPFRGFIGRVRQAGRTAADELAEVLDDIRRINERVIGQAERFIELTADQRAGEAFEIVAAADFPKAYAKDPRAIEHLVRIGVSGPRAGRHLILEWDSQAPLPHDFSKDQLRNALYIDCRQPNFDVDRLPSGGQQKQFLEIAMRSGLQHKSGDWEVIVRPEHFFALSSARRIETPVGERLRFWLGDDDEGKPSAHAMIAGQTGSGKSYLLHVLITGLASRYSPDELRFVLIDGKQGVEFEAYRKLPHADIVCLRTSPAMARSTLADFVAEMDERYELFQEAGVVKLEEYCEKTGSCMPRKVLIVDEYQQLLEGDPEFGSNLLNRVLEKGRAAGTHVVLGSQTFQPQGLAPSALTHVHTRAALSLAQDYVQTIQVFGSEGKRLIRELSPSGQLVINDESGRDGANSRGAVARFRRNEGEDTLADAVAEIIEAAGGSGQAIVLSGRDAAVISDNPFVMGWRGKPLDRLHLEEIARHPVRMGGFGIERWTAADTPVGLWLGRRFDVYGHALCVLRRAPAQNLLVLGAQIEVRNRMLASALAALPSMLEAGKLEVVLIDGLRPEMPGGGILRLACDKLKSAGVRVTVVDDKGVASVFAVLDKLVRNADHTGPTRLVVIAEPEYLYALHGGADRFAIPADGPPAQLRTLLAKGPPSGMHTILTAAGLSAFAALFSPSRESRLFDHRAVQQMNDDDTMTLFSSLIAARINEQTDHPFAALLVDQIQGPRASVLFHAYAAQRQIHADQGLKALQAELSRVLPG
jgi:DNA segregation ATPase FtsK/SpoIIIE, S-DNA-T family